MTVDLILSHILFFHAIWFLFRRLQTTGIHCISIDGSLRVPHPGHCALLIMSGHQGESNKHVKYIPIHSTLHSVAVALMMPWKICICYCSTVWLNPRWPPTKVQSSLPIHDPDLELTPNSCKKVITFRDFSSARAHWSRGLSATATAIPSLESTTGVAAVVFLPSLSRVHITNCPWWLITPQHWDLGLILFPFFTVAETQCRMSLRNQTPFFSRKRSVHIA